MNEKRIEVLVQELRANISRKMPLRVRQGVLDWENLRALALEILAPRGLDDEDTGKVLDLLRESTQDMNRMDLLAEELKTEVLSRTDTAKLTDKELRARIEGMVDERVGGSAFTIDEQVLLSESVYNAIRGLGVLGEILRDESITEVMINGPDNIFIERDGKLQRMNRRFESERRLEDIIYRVVSERGREVNQRDPIVDTRLEDGSRVNVVLPPISLVGPVVTIRKFSKTPMTVEQLIRYGSISREIADLLEKLVQAKFNIFISGGTGSGKTTFLNALSNFIPKDERIITIEDSAELKISGIENLVSLETRNANSSGVGEVTIRDLIKSSLRMRPERIVVGEVRGGEALDMLQAMNTGHDGSLSTGHANSSEDMLSRLETMVLQGAVGMPLQAIRQQIASALDIIIHLSRLRDHSRKTMEITEVVGMEGEHIKLNPLFVFQEDEHSTRDRVSGSLVRTENRLTKKHRDKLQMSGIEIDL
jgi:pilus assembly protein CpaF